MKRPTPLLSLAWIALLLMIFQLENSYAQSPSKQVENALRDQYLLPGDLTDIDRSSDNKTIIDERKKAEEIYNKGVLRGIELEKLSNFISKYSSDFFIKQQQLSATTLAALSHSPEGTTLFLDALLTAKPSHFDLLTNAIWQCAQIIDREHLNTLEILTRLNWVKKDTYDKVPPYITQLIEKLIEELNLDNPSHYTALSTLKPHLITQERILKLWSKDLSKAPPLRLRLVELLSLSELPNKEQLFINFTQSKEGKSLLESYSLVRIISRSLPIFKSKESALKFIFEHSETASNEDKSQLPILYNSLLTSGIIDEIRFKQFNSQLLKQPDLNPKTLGRISFNVRAYPHLFSHQFKQDLLDLIFLNPNFYNDKDFSYPAAVGLGIVLNSETPFQNEVGEDGYIAKTFKHPLPVKGLTNELISSVAIAKRLIIIEGVTPETSVFSQIATYLMNNQTIGSINSLQILEILSDHSLEIANPYTIWRLAIRNGIPQKMYDDTLKFLSRYGSEFPPESLNFITKLVIADYNQSSSHQEHYGSAEKDELAVKLFAYLRSIPVNKELLEEGTNSYSVMLSEIENYFYIYESADINDFCNLERTKQISNMVLELMRNYKFVEELESIAKKTSCENIKMKAIKFLKEINPKQQYTSH